MVHPTVQTRPMENVPTVPQPPDLFASFELVQANGATLRRLSHDHQLLELYNGKDFTDQEGRYGRILGSCSGPVILPDGVRLEEIGKPEAAEKSDNYIADETQKPKRVNEEFR
ncbi:hypothetical protein V6N13_086966 [Hibiscus sabdariffa]